MTHTIRTPAQLSAHLRSIRKSRGLTQARLGTRVGLPQSRIAKIELDPGLVGIGQLIRILTALDTEITLQPRRKPSPRTKSSTSDW